METVRPTRVPELTEPKYILPFKILLLASFAVWFGGFTFYVSFVVPIGTEILGSARAQGFITQQVTHRLNWMCAIAVAFMLIESWRTWQTKPGRVVQLMMTVAIAAMLIGLFVLHPILDGLIDTEARMFRERSRFYSLHRIYLWLSTFQWIAAWVWLAVTVRRWRPNDGESLVNNS